MKKKMLLLMIMKMIITKTMMMMTTTMMMIKKTIEVSYIQLMAFIGSIKCFKYAIMDESFEYDNLVKYAIAGSFNFDDCFEVSFKYNRNEISYWLLKNYDI